MHIATNLDLVIKVDTMHKYVVGPATLKTRMCMLLYELDRGAWVLYQDAMETRVHFEKDVTLEQMTPLRHRIMNRCILCQSSWSPWRLPWAYPAIMLTLKIPWITQWRSQLNSGWHPMGLQEKDVVEGVSILGHIYISFVWPRQHGNLPAELGGHVGPTS